MGKVVNPGLSWNGYAAGATTIGTVTPQDLFDCDGSKGLDAIVFDVAAEWCAACQSQAADAPKLFAQYDALGIRVVMLVVQDASQALATTSTAQAGSSNTVCRTSRCSPIRRSRSRRSIKLR